MPSFIDMTPPGLWQLISVSIWGGGGVLVDSRGTLDMNMKLAKSILITRNSQHTLRGRNDLSHMIS